MQTHFAIFYVFFLKNIVLRDIFTQKGVKMTEQDILDALREAYKRSGTQAALAEKAGVSQGRIADYLNGRCSVGNMSVSKLLKLFRDIRIDFFGDKTGDTGVDLIRKQLLEVFDTLSPADQMKCLSLVIANFPDKIKQNDR